MSKGKQLAAACAGLIRFWHEHYGLAERPTHMTQKEFDRYRQRLEYFRNADLSDRTAQEEIAREQQSGIFESHYAAAIPQELWDKIARLHEIVGALQPQSLGEAAKWIMEYMRALEDANLPEGELRRTVPAASKAALLYNANEFYADIIRQQAHGVGGMNVLLSCSLERYPWSQEEGGHVTLLKPETLGLRIVARGEREDDLIDALRDGELIVEQAIGGPIE
jgi:hypothetical protein